MSSFYSSFLKASIPRFRGVKLLFLLLFMQVLIYQASAQEVATNGVSALSSQNLGVIPATAGDIFLPQGEFSFVEMARTDLSVEIVPIPVADYTSNFASDVENYKQVVERWMAAYPESLVQEDPVTQKLIALGYYDTLLKWQIQRNNINKIAPSKY